MSDNENPPSKQTSSVPLKKETVRVTLKAADAPAASPTGAPPAPAAPKPTAGPPKAPTAPVPTKPPTPTAPAATIGKAPAPAPTIPLKTAAGTTTGSAPAAAPTIKLNTSPMAPTAPGGPPKPASAPTAPLKAPGAPTAPGSAPAPGPTIALPKATVQLNPPTQPLGTQGPAASQMATMPVSEEEESGASPLLSALSIIGFLGAAAVIAIQLMTANVWLTKDDQGKTIQADWARLF